MSEYGVIKKGRPARRLNYDAPLREPITRAEETAICAEICARLIQWREGPPLNESPPFLWLQRISALGQDNPDALWLYLHIQSGDLSALTQTYQEQADQRGTSRQAIKKKNTKAYQAMSIHFPDLKDALSSLQSVFKPPSGINTKDRGDSNTPRL